MKNAHRIKVKTWKKIFHANGKGKKVGIATLMSNKIASKIKARGKKNTT